MTEIEGAVAKGRLAPNRFERWLIYAGIAVLTWTAISFLLGGLASLVMFLLMISIIGFPVAWLLSQSATVAFYLVASAPLYLLLRRWSRAAAAVIALGTSIGWATLVALKMNESAEAKVRAFIAKDTGGPVALQPGRRVARLYSWGKGFNWDNGCEDHCQRLLFSGVASEVLLGDLSAMQGKAALKRYRLDRSDGSCGPQRVTPAYADERDVARDFFPRPLLSEKLAEINRQGRCLSEATANIREADYILFEQFQPNLRGSDHRAFDPGMGQVSGLERKAVYQVGPDGFRTLFQRSYAVAPRLAVPLQIEMPFTFDTYVPGHWRTNGVLFAGNRGTAYLSELITNDLAVSGLGENVVRAATGIR